MTNPSVATAPRVWSETELEQQAQIAIDEFVDRRLAEPEGTYAAHVRARRRALVRLFRVLSKLDPMNPSVDLARDVIRDPDLFAALRYVAGPPVSEDDLGTLITRSLKGLTQTAIAKDPFLSLSVLKLIQKLCDPYRFPWVGTDRSPSLREVRAAIAMSSVLHASQALQTERRSYGKTVEQRLQKRLTDLGFVKVTGGRKPKSNPLPPFPPRGKVTQPSHHPIFPHFYGECIVYGRKVDLLIALRTGRVIALEAKDSSSALNSTKRLLNDTAAKAARYRAEAGKNITSVALLSGVFKLSDLAQAQESGLYLIWAHELDEFVQWIQSQI